MQNKFQKESSKKIARKDVPTHAETYIQPYIQTERHTDDNKPKILKYFDLKKDENLSV